MVVIEHMSSARERHANPVNGRPAIIDKKGELYLYRHLEREELALDNLPPLVGYRLMVRACKMGAIEWVKILLGKVPLDYQDETGDTPLLLACFWLNFPKENQSITESDLRIKFEIVRLLVVHGAKVNGAEVNGAYDSTMRDSPLVMAADGGCYNIVKLLLRAGARVPGKKHFGIKHRFEWVDPRVSMLTDRVYAVVTELTNRKREASLIVMGLRISHPISSDLMGDILKRVPRSSTLHVNLEEIIDGVELACAWMADDLLYMG